MAPLRVGRFESAVPVVLAPMAGITNVAYRTLCREFGLKGLNDSGVDTTAPNGGVAAAPGLYVSEMVTARALVERDAETLRMVAFAPNEQPRSVQLYGVDPVVVGQAAAMVRDDNLADHIDLNFGCPVPKVTRKGGGSALPYKRKLFREVVRQAVANAGDLPVTVKMRIGIDDDHITYLDAGRAAQEEGAQWVALHARTAQQFYSGHAQWDAIARLKDTLDIPVLGNGDIWEASDALRMVEETGCDGVVVGRGCLGRPWLFADLASAFSGRTNLEQPKLRSVAATMRRHAELLVERYDERKGCVELRKHIAWYLKGFSVGGQTRFALANISSLQELDDLLGTLDLEQTFPTDVLGAPRGRTNAAKRVALPDRWLDDPDDDMVVTGYDAELALSGG